MLMQLLASCLMPLLYVVTMNDLVCSCKCREGLVLLSLVINLAKPCWEGAGGKGPVGVGGGGGGLGGGGGGE